MSEEPTISPVLRLLQALPSGVAAEKRKAIRADLGAIGKYEHFRQCVLRPGWNIGDTHISCALVLMNHLDITMRFFTGTDQERDGQIAKVIKYYAQREVTPQAQRTEFV